MKAAGKQPGYMTSLESYAKVLLVKIFRATRLTDQQNLYDDIRKIAPGILKFIEDNYTGLVIYPITKTINHFYKWEIPSLSSGGVESPSEALMSAIGRRVTS